MKTHPNKSPARIQIPALVSLSLSIFSTPALAAPDAAEIARTLAPIRLKHDVPALAGAIVDKFGLVAAGAAGVRKRGDPTFATPNDRWHLGSNTKAMTATLAARMVERGSLRMEATLGETFPELAGAMHPAARGINLMHLLTNRSGVPANPDWGRIHSAGGSMIEQRLRAVAFAGSAPPAFAPGSGFLYSNLGFASAGAMLERAGRRSWEDLTRVQLFAPLAMLDCGFGGVGTPGRIDQPWGHHDDGRPADRNGPTADNVPALGPAGTVHCTLESWAGFIADQLRGARGEKAMLAPETYRRLHTPLPGGDYAYGWTVVQRDWAGGPAITHNGSNTTNFSVAWLAPRRGFAVLAVSNQGGRRAEKALDEAASVLIQLHLKAAR